MTDAAKLAAPHTNARLDGARPQKHARGDAGGFAALLKIARPERQDGARPGETVAKRQDAKWVVAQLRTEPQANAEADEIASTNVDEIVDLAGAVTKAADEPEAIDSEPPVADDEAMHAEPENSPVAVSMPISVASLFVLEARMPAPMKAAPEEVDAKAVDVVPAEPATDRPSSTTAAEAEPPVAAAPAADLPAATPRAAPTAEVATAPMPPKPVVIVASERAVPVMPQDAAAISRMPANVPIAADATVPANVGPAASTEIGQGKPDDGQQGTDQRRGGNEPAAAKVAIVADQPLPPPATGQASTGLALASAISSDAGWKSAIKTVALPQHFATQMNGAPVHSLKLQLHPAELGMVTANLRFAGDQMTVEIQVENHEAYQRLTADRDTIISSLRGLGYQIDQVTVMQPSVGAPANARADSGATGTGAGNPGGQSAESGSAGPGGDRTANQGAGRGRGDEARQGHGNAQTASERAGRGIYI